MMLFFTISNNNLRSTSQQSTVKSFINLDSISQNNCKPSWSHKTTCTSWRERISKVSWWRVEEKQKLKNEVAKNDYQHIVRKMCNFRAFWKI
jgi:hypothetical protein